MVSYPQCVIKGGNLEQDAHIYCFGTCDKQVHVQQRLSGLCKQCHNNVLRRRHRATAARLKLKAAHSNVNVIFLSLYDTHMRSWLVTKSTSDKMRL